MSVQPTDYLTLDYSESQQHLKECDDEDKLSEIIDLDASNSYD